MNWEKLEQDMIAVRRDLHKYPESAWTEFRTSSIVAERLSKLGLSPKAGIEVIDTGSVMGRPSEDEIDRHIARAKEQGGNAEWIDRMQRFPGAAAEIDTGRPGPTVVMRFDIDCVDVPEDTSDKHRPAREGFVSVNPNVAHACGHDAHTAIGLGTAEALTEIRDELNGRIRLIFQPGEEGSRGAYAMTMKGLVDDADYFLAMHIGMNAETGTFGLSSVGYLATTKFDVRFNGVPAHAAGAPHKGKNAILAAASAVLGLYSIAPHSDGDMRINVGVLNAGTGRNVIAPHALMKVETRGETSEIADYVYSRAVEVINGAAAMYGVTAELEKTGESPTTSCSGELAQRIGRIVREAGIFRRVEDSVPAGGSEDAMWMMRRVQERGGQAVYMALGSNITAPHHNGGFDVDESAMVLGVRALTAIARDLMRR